MTQAMIDRFTLNCAIMCLNRIEANATNLLSRLNAPHCHHVTNNTACNIYLRHVAIAKNMLKTRVNKFLYFFRKMQKQYCTRHKKLCTLDSDETKRWIVTLIRLYEAYKNLIKNTPYESFI